MNVDAGMGVALAVIVGVSLALAQAIGPLLVYLTEAVKATGKVKPGYAGIVTLVLGMAIGGTLGALTNAMSAADSYGYGTMVAVGIFGGALMAAQAVSSYKSMGSVNPQSVTTTVTTGSTGDDDPESYQSIAQQRMILETSAPMTNTTLTQEDIDAMQAELAANHGPVAESENHILPAPPLPEPETSTDSRR